MTATQLQRLLDKEGMTQVGAARAIGISDRNMRRYASGDLPVPLTVELALLRVIERSSLRVVDIAKLTPRELESFSEAIEVARSVRSIGDSFISSQPVRDAKGRFCEVRVYLPDDLSRVAAVVPIDSHGRPKSAEVAE